MTKERITHKAEQTAQPPIRVIGDICGLSEVRAPIWTPATMGLHQANGQSSRLLVTTKLLRAKSGGDIWVGAAMPIFTAVSPRAPESLAVVA